ncbi:MAG: ABC transporter substrate-binding protein [Treponema sp.]|nr:ABC transporter substrate-binding protein [Treponema sp.]
MNVSSLFFRAIKRIAVGVSLAAALAACSKAAPGAAAPAAPSTVVSSPNMSIAGGIPPWEGYNGPRTKIRDVFALGMTGIGNQFAIAKGWYKDAGFDLEHTEASAITSNAVEVFAAGEGDIADGDPGTYIPAIVNGVPIKIVGNMWRNRGAFWIIAQPGIKTFEDLRGKKIGTGSPTGGMRTTTMETLRLNGIDPEKDVELVAAGFYQTAYAALISGAVDATIIHQPFATMAQREGNGNILAKTWEYLPAYHTGVIVISQKLIDEQPDVVERLLQVYYYGNEYARTHLDEFFPWAAKYLNLPEDVAREAITAEIELWENDPIVDIGRLQVTQNMLAQYKMQRSALPVDNVVDNTFAERVAQTLKLGKYRE